MPHHQSETPLALTGGASCESCGGYSRDLDSLATTRAQFLKATHSVRPDLATMLATVVFDEGIQ